METQFQLQPSTAGGARGGGGVINSVARPLLMPSPTTSAGQSPSHSHQLHQQNRGSIPPYFPETFKDFFSMLTEDEDHGEVITNLLEDKVIPRSPKCGGERRNSVATPRKTCDKPFCCHNSSTGGTSNSAATGTGLGSGVYLDSPAYSGGGLTRTLSSKYYRRRPSQHRLLPGDGAHLLDSAVGSSTSTGSSMTSLNNNFGRSNSFRLHRPAPSAASTYSSYLSYQPVDRNLPVKNNQCKHIQYCCLHQQQEEKRQGTSLQAPSSSSCSTLSLNERGTGRLLPFSPIGPSVSMQRVNQQQQQHTQDGINFSDDEKKSLIYPQLTSDRYMKGIDCGPDANNEDQKHRYSLLTKSYDQINRSRIFEPSTKSRRSSCDTPDQQQQPSSSHNLLYGGGGGGGGTSTSGTDQATVSSISTTTSVTEGDDEFDSPSTIKYKLIANVAGPYQRTTSTTTTTANNNNNSSGTGQTSKSQVNIITNPLVRQYPFETNYKTKKMYANETIVTHQPGGNLKTISYGVGTAPGGGVGVDLKKSPLVNRRRSSSVTLPQPPIAAERYIKGSGGTGMENNNGIFDGGGTSKADSRNSRDRFQSGKSGRSNAANEVSANAQQQPQQSHQQPKGNQQAQQQRFGKQRQRMRTASMPAENRKPRLAEMRRSAIHCADVDIEYYRLRSFSITSHGICNLGDSMRSRRSRSINSVTSTGTSNSGRDRNNSNASQTMNELNDEGADGNKESGGSGIPAYKVAMLGSSGVGKTALTYQFTTSEYICAYDLSLDDDYGQKTVSVLLNGQETDLEVVDHPACEMSTEAFCATYNIDIFVVVYSIVDRKSFKAAERVLHYLRDNDCLLTRGAILVGNKTDLERQREVPVQVGKKLAKEINCKFIETSSGLDHNVDELLVGIVAQVKLNPQRVSRLTDKQRLLLACQPQQTGNHFGPNKFASVHGDSESKGGGGGGGGGGSSSKNGKLTRKRQGGHSTGPLNSFDLHSLKHSVMTKQGKRKAKGGGSPRPNPSNEDLREEDEDNKSTSSSTSSSSESLCSSRSLKSSRSTTSLDREMSNFKSRLGSGSCSTNSTPIKRAGHRHNHRRAATDGEMDEIRRDEEAATSGSGSGQGKASKSAKSSPVKFGRTKMFLTSFLKFRKSLRMRRRSSSSCSDFFVI